jgi:hypothetical protein
VAKDAKMLPIPEVTAIWQCKLFTVVPLDYRQDFGALRFKEPPVAFFLPPSSTTAKRLLVI